MGGSGGSPFWSLPVVSSVTICASVHPGIPARGGATSAHFGIGTMFLKSSGAPWSHRSLMNSPLSFRGEWQSTHMATCSTRYFPRATVVFDLGAGSPAATEAETVTSARAATAIPMCFTFMLSPLVLGWTSP